MGSSRVFLVTGANQGIGLATIRALLKLPGENVCYLGSRNEGRGREAVSLLEGRDYLARRDGDNQPSFI